MNEKQSYAKMLEIPVSTTNITYKPSKKRKKKATLEKVKETLLAKINAKTAKEEQPVLEIDEQVAQETTAVIEDKTVEQAEEIAVTEELNGVVELEENNGEINAESDVSITTVKKKKFKLDIVSVQVAVIVVLIGFIAISSYFVKDSGINVFLSHVFGTNQTQEIKDYSDFSPEIFSSANVTVNDGVMTMHGESSIYSPCEGVVSAVELGQDGKYSVTVTHSETFVTTITGLDYAYCEVGSTIYKKIPLGFSEGDKVSVCFFSEGKLLQDFILDGSNVVWQV